MKAIVFYNGFVRNTSGCWGLPQWGHIKPVIRNEQTIVGITVYAGENEQYYSFITPEAIKALQEWMDYRMQAGEQVTPDSWVMRDLWDTSFPSGGGFVTVPKKLKSSG